MGWATFGAIISQTHQVTLFELHTEINEGSVFDSCFPRKKMFQRGPGLPDGLFSNKNPRLGKFWRVLE
jgi:hypothetical protein